MAIILDALINYIEIDRERDRDTKIRPCTLDRENNNSRPENEYFQRERNTRVLRSQAVTRFNMRWN